MCGVCDQELPSLSRRRFSSGVGALAAAAALPRMPAYATPSLLKPQAVNPPPGYDFSTAPASIRSEWGDLEGFYRTYFNAMTGALSTNAYGMALANQVVGLLQNDPAYILIARSLFATHRDTTKNAYQKHLADLGVKYSEYLISGNYPKGPIVTKGNGLDYIKDPAPTGDFRKIVLGQSVIHVNKNAIVKTQVDRVTRDWLLAYRASGAPWDYTPSNEFGSHESARLTELVEYCKARVVPVWGMKATKIDERWYAPDAEGSPRFEISEDKVNNYPSTIVVDDRTAIVNDTHGISAIAWDALDASLVLGCGDHPGKIDAAYYLADRGVNVYVPFDRSLHFLIGARTSASIVGSAPIKKTANGAEIGNQPVAIDIDEPIVVSNAPKRYPLQYYDTPYRYFHSLSNYIRKPLKIIDIPVTKYETATKSVVDAGRQVGARVLGIRVRSVEEYDAVATWLKEDVTHRAVLFHTAGYQDGYKLFAKFPSQTTFGDIRPAFY